MSEDYLGTFHRADILDILADENSSKHFSININFIELYEHNDELARDLLSKPEVSLEEWDKAAFRTQMTLLKEVDKRCNLKSNIHCRVFHLAHLARKTAFPCNRDEGTFLQISGTVMRVTATKLLEHQRSYVCVTCKTPNLIKAVYNRKYMIKQPKQCKNPEGCSGTNLIHFGDLDGDNCKDYQEIKIQEQIKKLGMGSVPNTMLVTLEDDLVDSCQPGDDVTICGTVKRRFGEFSLGKKPDIDLVFKANHIQVDSNNNFNPTTNPDIENIFNNFWQLYSENKLEGRDLILKSFCPDIYGLYPVKLAMAVVLAGGCSTEDITLTNVKTRSEAHLLLVGDPGTGKSKMLRFATKIIPRAVLTTGVGSTAAGLTVTAKMEHGEWQLEAGALVMADGGICCIDEFNSMKEHDRTAIHEAMEQQTISVAKASMVCKLNTRCTILAACNPKGNIDPTQTMSMNIALPSPLLSRFDLVMIIRDTVNEEWDELVVDYILNGGNDISKLTDFGLWPVKNLQAYFKRIKQLQPKLTDKSELILRRYYNLQRGLGNRNKARTTVRLLESLVRLSQGHARLMYHDKVLVIDSIYAIYLVDISMDIESSVLNLNTCVNSVFPERPKSAYQNLLEVILNKLQLPDILENELSTLTIEKEQQIQSRFFVNPKQASISGSNHSGCNDDDRSNEKGTHFDIVSVGKSQTTIDEASCSNPTEPAVNGSIIEKTVENDKVTNKKNSETKSVFKKLKFSKNITGDKSKSKNHVNAILEDTKEPLKRAKFDTVVSHKSGELAIPSTSRILQVSPNDDNGLRKDSTHDGTTVRGTKGQNVNSRADITNSVEKRNTTSLIDSGLDESMLDKNTNTSNFNYREASSKTSTFKNTKPLTNDFEMLKLLPSVNEDFEIDFDTDWDALGAVNKNHPSTSDNLESSKSKRGKKNKNIFASSEDVDYDI